jgi:predicted transcriptional regulator
MDSAKLLKSLKEAIACQPETVPKGWKTMSQLATEWGISIAHAIRLIRKGIDMGTVEQRKFRIQNGRRGVYPTWHYIAKSEETKSKETRSSRTRK